MAELELGAWNLVLNNYFQPMNKDEQNNQTGELNRRDFLQRGSLATLMTVVGAVELVAQQPAADEKTRSEERRVGKECRL